METKIIEIAQRIRELREILEISVDEMAHYLSMEPDMYLRYEDGKEDFTFTFLYQCATKFGVDLIELVTGDRPKLSFYTVVKKDHGLPIKRRAGFSYQHLAHLFKNKTAEPFLVTAPYSEAEQDKPIKLSYHKGQEFDYIISGQLKVAMENHIEILNAGDAIYYDSGHGHGMIATGGQECVFLAVIMKNENEEDK